MPKNHNFRDITGQKFGRLTVMWPAGRSGVGKATFWTCYCECGSYCSVSGSLLKNGDTKGCGCIQREWSRSGLAHHTHGMSRTPEAMAYAGAFQRCTNLRDKGYKNYGGRGIKFRFRTFEEFFADIGPKPTPKHSLDRIDNDGHYQIGNVRWATRLMQAANRRPIVRIKLKCQQCNNKVLRRIRSQMTGSLVCGVCHCKELTEVVPEKISTTSSA